MKRSATAIWTFLAPSLMNLEIPTPTWVAKDVAFYGVQAPDDAVLVHQERGYTSPIWYSPK